jgi:ABC-2 type transport system permease protein
LTQNQIVAFLMAMFIGIFFHLLFDVIGSSLRGSFGELFTYLSMSNHFESMSRGVVDSKDLVYFGSIITGGIVFSQAMLSKKNWQP